MKRLDDLIAHARQTGYVTYSELAEALPDGIVDAWEVDQIVTLLTSLNVRLVECAPDKEERASENAYNDVPDLDDEREASTNSVGLTRLEAQVLRMRFGIDSEKDCDYTVQAVAAKLGIMPERIREIEEKALAKLRAPLPNQTRDVP